MIRPEPIIIYVDSYSIIGSYYPKLNRIEISKYLRDFPELHSYVLGHELKHATFPPCSPKHFWFDLIDNARFFLNLELLHQFSNFKRLPNGKLTKKELAFIFAYDLLTIPRTFLSLLCIFPIILSWLKKAKKKIPLYLRGKKK